MREEADALDAFLMVIKTTDEIVRSENVTHESTLFNVLEWRVTI